MKATPSTEERVWAVLAHLSALAFGMGLLLPVIGWSEQRRKSKYVAFHSLQALGYQSLGYTVWLLGYLLFTVLIVIVMLVVLTAVGDGKEDILVASIIGFDIVLVLMVFGSLGVYLLLPVIAAISCGLGKDFRYPFLGTRLATYLEYATETDDWLNEEHEDRWVAAVGHFAVIIQLWGILPPVLAWIMQAKRSPFLKFQSIQTVAFQGLVTLFSVGAGVVYMFGFLAFAVLTGFGESAAMDSSANIAGLIFLLGSMLIALLMVLVIPLFHITGQWAGYRVLKGDDYRYPLLGKLVERWVSKK
jgi:uncharacterized Tic20 family protein